MIRASAKLLHILKTDAFGAEPSVEVVRNGRVAYDVSYVSAVCEAL